MPNFLIGIQSTSSALAAERARMDAIGQNIAYADATKGADGKLYQRQHVIFEKLLISQMQGESPISSVQARVVTDHRPPRMVYQPDDPNADRDGMLALPNIDIHEEMADLISSSRNYEANLAVVKNARQMAMQALSIGKR